MENVRDYPRPPKLERFEGSIKVQFGGNVILQTNNAFRVLETFHPPTYYVAPSDFAAGALQRTQGNSICEWKGQAAYFDIEAGGQKAERAAWCYPKPTPAFEPIAGFVSVYAEPMDAVFVNGELVTPQPGNFYGGWVNSWITGPIKGAPGTTHW
ncbi:MAG: DUF427 domain-containing protein [Pseudomonadota bacterium]